MHHVEQTQKPASLSHPNGMCSELAGETNKSFRSSVSSPFPWAPRLFYPHSAFFGSFFCFVLFCLVSVRQVLKTPLKSLFLTLSSRLFRERGSLTAPGYRSLMTVRVIHLHFRATSMKPNFLVIRSLFKRLIDPGWPFIKGSFAQGSSQPPSCEIRSFVAINKRFALHFASLSHWFSIAVDSHSIDTSPVNISERYTCFFFLLFFPKDPETSHFL